MGGLTNQKKTKELIANTIRDLSSTWATYHTFIWEIPTPISREIPQNHHTSGPFSRGFPFLNHHLGEFPTGGEWPR